MDLLRRLVCALALLLLFRLPAEAQDAEFNDVIKRAVVEFDQGHWEEAGALFRRAHELNPSARTWRGLGLTSFELRRYVNAIAELEAALADPRKPLTSVQRKEVETVLTRAREFVSVYRVRVVPGQAEVLVDGHPVTLNDGQLFLDPGAHTVVVRASGYEERREDLRAAAGARDELAIELSVAGPPPDAPPAAETAARAEPAPAAPPGRKRWIWTWALGSAAVAAGAAAIGLGVATNNKNDDFQRCGATQGCEGLAEKGKSLQLGTNLSIGLAGAFAIGAITAFFLEGRRPAEEKRAQLLLSPGGAALRGSF
jgi:tetratricopeptide (TPR) repeat protein